MALPQNVVEKIAKIISPFFDVDYYVSAVPEVKDSGMEPIFHYINVGWKQKHNPSAHFDSEFYLSSYPDVAKSGDIPLLHYARFGHKEGRKALPPVALGSGKVVKLADSRPQTLPTAEKPASRAIATTGPASTVNEPKRLEPIDEHAVKGSGKSHAAGGEPTNMENSSTSEALPEFETLTPTKPEDVQRVRDRMDAKYYLSQYPDVLAAAADPAEHYCEIGWRLGYDPCPGFSTSYYLKHNKDVLKNQANPFLHYLRNGMNERFRLVASVAEAEIYDRFDEGPLRAFVEAAEALDPMVALPDTRRLIASRRSQSQELLNVVQSLREQFHGRTWRVCITLPRCQTSDATKAISGLVSSLTKVFGADQILIVTTDSDIVDPDAGLPNRIERIGLSTSIVKLSSEERRAVLLDLLRGLEVGLLVNVESRLCWDTFRDFCRQMSAEMTIMAYIFPWELNSKGTPTGHVVQWLHETIDYINCLVIGDAGTAENVRDRFGLSEGRDKVIAPPSADGDAFSRFVDGLSKELPQ